ncbi:MAG TPA: hypothetical protein VLD13_04035 [Gaiellaceae bacterium]|nr:hypothetical protein [Gaiellaceae bacterium]
MVRGTTGFTVDDAHGRRVGLVEAPLYGTRAESPDAIAVRGGRILHRHYMVPTRAIRVIDRDGHAITLRLDRDRLQRFL